MADITMYELPGCPYCAKVRSKLDDLELDYDIIEVPRSHDERTEVEKVSGQTSVPVITDEANDIEGMNESDDIIEYLEETYGDGAA